MATGDQFVRQCRIIDLGPDFLPHKFRELGVHLRIDQGLWKGSNKHFQRPVGPAILVNLPTLVGGQGRRMTLLRRIPGKATKSGVYQLTDFGVVGPPCRHGLLIDLVVFHAHRVLGGALKHRQFRHLRRQGLDHLNTGGTIADDAYSLALEVNRVLGPAGGVVDLPLEALLVREGQHVGCGKQAHATDKVTGRKCFPGVGHHPPAALVFQPLGRLDPRLQFD